jgi:hypothetical protein
LLFIESLGWVIMAKNLRVFFAFFALFAVKWRDVNGCPDSDNSTL